MRSEPTNNNFTKTRLRSELTNNRDRISRTKPAGRHPGRPPLPPATARARTRSPPGTTPRPALPAFPSGRAGPPSCPAAQRVRGAFPLVPVPRVGRPGPGPAVAIPTVAGLDAAGGAERPRRGPTDGPARERQPLPAGPATPAADPGTPGDPLLTIEEVTAELRVSRAAFYRWRQLGAAPSAVRLPGGGVRVPAQRPHEARAAQPRARAISRGGSASRVAGLNAQDRPLRRHSRQSCGHVRWQRPNLGLQRVRGAGERHHRRSQFHAGPGGPAGGTRVTAGGYHNLALTSGGGVLGLGRQRRRTAARRQHH